jgi:hypothetical protein
MGSSTPTSAGVGHLTESVAFQSSNTGAPPWSAAEGKDMAPEVEEEPRCWSGCTAGVVGVKRMLPPISKNVDSDKHSDYGARPQ